MPAQFNLGCRYFAGEGVEKNLKEAESWWRKSADQGYAYAIENLAKLLA